MRHLRKLFTLSFALTLALTFIAEADENSENATVVITAEQAVDEVAEQFPELLESAPSGQLNGSSVDPDLKNDGDVIDISGSLAQASLSTDPADGFSLTTDAGTFEMAPVIQGASTSDAAVVGDSVVYANTAPASDTVVRPTVLGLETFTQLRDASAPDTIKLQVAPKSDQTIQQLTDGSIAIVNDQTIENSTEATTPPSETDQSNDEPDFEVATNSPGSADLVTELGKGMHQLAEAQKQINGTIVAYLPSPVATDANGEVVPAHFVVDDNTINIKVDITPEHTYPISVDPNLLAGASPEEIAYCGDWRHWIACGVVRLRAEQASWMTAIYYPQYYSDSHNNPADALRHCYWNALMTIDFGRREAKGFADRHENRPSNPADEKSMDLFNNKKGRKFARKIKQTYWWWPSDWGRFALSKCYNESQVGGKLVRYPGLMPGADLESDDDTSEVTY